MLSTLTGDLWLRSVFKKYFYDWLVFFKQQDGNFFSKTEKNIVPQETRKGPYILNLSHNLLKTIYLLFIFGDGGVGE